MAKKQKGYQMSASTAVDTTTKARRGPPKIEDRIAPKITAIVTNIPIPEVASQSRRGTKSAYPFDDLAVGASFGVSNKELKQVASVVSQQNRRHLVKKLDAAGNVVYKKQAVVVDGQKREIDTDQPEMVPTKRFFAAAVNPKTDPAGASVRVWRKL